MKQTLLEITQDILSSLDGDEVNSIFDTTESEQVARCIRQAYLYIVSGSDLPRHFDITHLEPSGDASLPIVMHRPERIQEILWIKYDNRLLAGDNPLLEEIEYVAPSDFIRDMYLLSLENSWVSSTSLVTSNYTIPLLYRNDTGPTKYTSLDDHILIFDGHNASLDSTLQQSKTVCYGVVTPSFSLTDNYTPDLEDSQFPLLLSEAKSLAFAELKQVGHSKAERTAKKQWMRLQRDKQNVPKRSSPLDRIPDYGRKR